MEGFIGVHLGAGQHSESLIPEYKKLVYKSCRKALELMKMGKSAVNIVAQTTAVLENSSITNAGFGSNLTWGGEVECDASIMDGSSLLYGAVGAVSGVKNPVILAEYLCEKQKMGLPLGRVPPSFLVGDGARKYAEKVGLQIVAPSELIAAQSLKLYRHYRKKVRRYHEEAAQAVATGSRLDTVGAVCIDSQGHVAAACSSGGIALKTSGRVGQAGVYASGVWAQDSDRGAPAVAVCTSGCGEYLIRTTLAKEAASSVMCNTRSELSLHECMKTKFLESPFLHDVDEKMGGIIVLKCSPSEDAGELLWCHSTNTMCVGYMSALDSKPTCQISSLSQGKETGHTLALGGVQFRCHRKQLKRPAADAAADAAAGVTASGSSASDAEEDITLGSQQSLPKKLLNTESI